MVGNTKKILIILLVFLFLGFLYPTVTTAIENTPLNVNQPIAQQQISQEQFTNLENQINGLRTDNYQTVISSYQQASDKLNQYTNGLTFIAAIFGVIMAMFTVFAGVNFFLTKKDFTEKLKEINHYVSVARQNALQVKKLTDETKKQTKKVPEIIKQFQKNREDMIQLLAKIKTTKTKKVKEFDDALSRIQETESKLSQKLLNTVSNIQSMNSQASIISASASISANPPVNIDPAYGRINPSGYVPIQEGVFGLKKCDDCGKSINPLEEPFDFSEGVTLPVGQTLCSDCKKKQVAST